MPEKAPSLDLDGWDDHDILDLVAKLRHGWSIRDDLLTDIKSLREKTWKVDVPYAWDQGTQGSPNKTGDHHSTLPDEIEARVLGTVTLRDPFFRRLPPDKDEKEVEKSETVERHFRAKFQMHSRSSLAGKDAWLFQNMQNIQQGAMCTASLYAPNVWAGAPVYMDGDTPKVTHWRDKNGKPTEDKADMDLEATSKAYLKSVDTYRRTAPTPLIWRPIETPSCYPMIVDGKMLAMVIVRKNAMMDMAGAGFAVQIQGSSSLLGKDQELIEVHTANRCRYYFGTNPVEHEEYGTDGITTNYGFVPFSYQAGMETGSLDWGTFGKPLLCLVADNIRTIDTLNTWIMHAVKMSSFTSYQVEWEKTPDGWTGSVVDGEGSRIQTYEFKSGTIMDFGPGKKVMPLTHPGVNKDLGELLKFNIEEVHRIIPRTLQGQAESSGYNTVSSTVQAKSIFLPLYRAPERHVEELCVMDMRHIAANRPPGPIYLPYDPPAGISGVPKNLGQVKIEKSDIRDYFDMHVTMDREVDRITLGRAANELRISGVGSKKDVAEAFGYENFAEVEEQRLIEEFKDMPEIKQALMGPIKRKFGLDEAEKQAKAQQRIETDPVTGVPLVRQPDGKMAGPGGATQTPSMQGPAGAALGGMNPSVIGGAANMGSTHNPGIAMPAPTARGRPRMRRRGGAIPGAPQRQGMMRPTEPAI